MLNLETNPFAKSTSAPSSTGSSITAANKAVKRWQLEQGRTNTKVQEIEGQIKAAKVRRAEAEQAVGEQLVEGLDTTAATRLMNQASEHVRVLESALAIAIQKDESAQVALKEAERQAAIEGQVEGVAQLKRAMLKADQQLLDLERLVVDEIGPSLNAARLILTSSGIREGELSFLSEVPLVFKQGLLLAVHTLLKEGFVPVNMRKYGRVSQCIPDEDFIRSRERPGPSTPKPIPGWNGGN
jgi:hypothetical protein